jgi:2-oxoisovalerate dehydrogenase E1 component
MRLCLDEKITMKLRGQHDIGGFFIGGFGEEVHGAATAQALWDAMELEPGVTAKDRLAIFPHYRSDALVDNVLQLQGYPHFVLDQFRQQAARATDPSAGGRQMVMHVSMVDYAIQPNQSALGMQAGKAVGYAQGWRIKGETRGVISLAVVGDGTTATSDFYEAVSAAALYGLPVLLIVTDNRVAISMPAHEAEPIRDLAAFASAFSMEFGEAAGPDFTSIYSATLDAARYVSRTGKPYLLRCPVTRFRGHSSSGLKDFDPAAIDPLVDFGRALVDAGLLAEEEALTPLVPWPDNKTRYLDNYVPNPLAAQLHHELRAMRDRVIDEPKPDPASIHDFAWAPFPSVVEPPSSWDGPRTELTVAQAIRAALDRALATGKAAVWGEDVGHTLGGVFGCTRYLPERHPGRVFNTPINEPLILGMATGASLHSDLAIFPEIQFADYSLNVVHWLVHLGHLHWVTLGTVSPNVTIRMPSDPTLTGALYHSMSVETYYAHAPSMVVVVPSNAFDAYGLLRTATMYGGPVVFCEPKDLYRVRHDPRGAGRLLQAGPKLPGERPPSDEDGVPEIDDFAVPFGKLRLAQAGDDITVVSYGLGLHKSLAAAKLLEREGVRAEVLDLRTVAPYDREGVMASVRRTGRLVVATEDRMYGSFANQIVKDAHEAVPGAQLTVVGMKDVPATGMAPALYAATVLTPERIVDAVRALLARKRGADGGLQLDNELAWLQHAPTWSRR